MRSVRSLLRLVPKRVARRSTTFTFTRRHFSQSSDIVNEVNRVMANPEDKLGNPVALDFSKGSKTKGYSKPYANNYDHIFNKNENKRSKPQENDTTNMKT